ncbi:hypothetical protein K435DRAFT_759709 [Dendrothele bispora CBS 962.96]|uniref:T6SS Phospholipase effector Tle1-like catalytic domain-containing protein n=1 Tax=Dendrothele bispora (strain CBS 962.96) TaxID=1314807 RepID=A0A4S8LQ69_DENBC|nr:hypothetical protein K435DRAFT_759709 [Dendrothele bispora CBS 962.96]
MSTDTDYSPKPRIHVLCFDGTSNEYNTENTNVVKFFSLLKKDNFGEQLCYYQAGIGTFFAPGVVSPLFEWCAKVLDEAVAWYLNAHVMDGYKFLMQNYCVGDKICLFGFSRGAYTARALAGMLYKVGLLPRDNEEQIPFAYKLYTREDDEGIKLSAGYKQTFCQDVKIEFLGVWDTVASVGVLMSKSLPFTMNNTSIKTFRHALSLDEHRARFKPNLWHRDPPESDVRAAALAAKANGAPTVKPLDPSEPKKRKRLIQSIERKMRLGRRSSASRRSEEKQPMTAEANRDQEASSSSSDSGAEDPAQPQPLPAPSPQETDVLEVWFAGCHSDVGGGNVSNDTKQSLANIPLRWMVQQVMLSQCGIQFDTAALTRLNIPLWVGPSPATGTSMFSEEPKPIPSSSEDSGSEADKEVRTSNGQVVKEKVVLSGKENTPAPTTPPSLDQLDATMPLHDALVSQKLWWILEVLPLKYQWQDAEGKWQSSWAWNLGRGRAIVIAKPKFHKTVQDRMNDSSLNYQPKARWDKNTQVPVYVE